MASIIVIALIFMYTVYVLIKFFKKSKSGGACAHCELNKSCTSNGCFSNTLHFLETQHPEKNANTTKNVQS